MFEVEQKYHVGDVPELESGLATLNAVAGPEQSHADTYFNHPCKDFAQTREALRIRRVDGVPSITYKGTKMPGEIKARRELEWRLDPGDPDGSQFESLLEMLGFRRVATVRKRRRSFPVDDGFGELTVTIDRVDQLGDFAEVEWVAPNEEAVENGRERIATLAERLNLRRSEPRSYLRMLLELGGDLPHGASTDD